MEAVHSREDILNMAKQIISGKRTQDYGPPEDSFAMIAKYWSTYLDREITSIDVANMMILLKVARQSGCAGSIDSYIDIAGYAACGGETYCTKKCEERPV